MASPVAVRSANCNLSRAALVASRLVVGDTSTVAVPPNAISPRLIPGVSSSANCFAACCAATIRFGSTSVARIDCDTSMTSITTARLRGIRTSLVGPAIAMVNNTNADTSRIAGTCRQREGRLGATLSSSSVLANRRTRRWRANCITTYSAASARTTTKNRKNHACSKPDRDIGPSRGSVTAARLAHPAGERR